MKRLKYDIYIGLGMHGRRVGDVLAQVAMAKSFCNRYGVTYYAPSDDEGLESMDRDSLIDSKPDLDRMEWYVKKDDAKLDRCRMLLMLTGDKASSGVLWEAGRMYYKCKRPIVIVSHQMYYGKLTNFTTIKAHYIRPTIESAVRSISNILRKKGIYALTT